MVLEQVRCNASDVAEWRLFKYVEEAEFRPGFPVNTVFVMGKLLNGNQSCQGLCKWMSTESCRNWLLEVKLCNDRVGPSVVFDLINDSLQSAAWKLPPTLHYQEYPPGVILVLMQSRTRKPFHRTTLLKQIVACLPRKLIVFVTHHHRDHVKGLSIIQKYNPNATLLAHENTMRWIGKGDWSLGYTPVSREEDILRHTDGHVALLDVSTNSLIAGDHCVGYAHVYFGGKLYVIVDSIVVV
ncbi:hypothetical protein CRYUN_Cryun21dG0085100 [Craigia yunnanensis]